MVVGITRRGRWWKRLCGDNKRTICRIPSPILGEGKFFKKQKRGRFSLSQYIRSFMIKVPFHHPDFIIYHVLWEREVIYTIISRPLEMKYFLWFMKNSVPVNRNKVCTKASNDCCGCSCDSHFKSMYGWSVARLWYDKGFQISEPIIAST